MERFCQQWENQQLTVLDELGYVLQANSETATVSANRTVSTAKGDTAKGDTHFC